jgi:hypothetical protein
VLAVRGRGGGAGSAPRKDDLCTQLPATPWRAVHAQPGRCGGGATIRGWAVEDKRVYRVSAPGLQNLHVVINGHMQTLGLRRKLLDGRGVSMCWMGRVKGSF